MTWSIPIEAAANVSSQHFRSTISCSSVDIIAAAILTGLDPVLRSVCPSVKSAWRKLDGYMQMKVAAALGMLSNMDPSPPFAGSQLRYADWYQDFVEPSDKGVVSFMVGGTVSRLYALQVLSAKWFIDFKRIEKLQSVSYCGESQQRPDYVAQDTSGRLYIIEAKGRSRYGSAKSAADIAAINGQLMEVVRIGGTPIFKGFAIGVGPEEWSRKLRAYVTDPPGYGEGDGLSERVLYDDAVRREYALVDRYVSRGEYHVFPLWESQKTNVYLKDEQVISHHIASLSSPLGVQHVTRSGEVLLEKIERTCSYVPKSDELETMLRKQAEIAEARGMLAVHVTAAPFAADLALSDGNINRTELEEILHIDGQKRFLTHENIIVEFLNG